MERNMDLMIKARTFLFYKDPICCTEEKGPGGSKTRDNEEGSGETEADIDREKTVS